MTPLRFIRIAWPMPVAVAALALIWTRHFWLGWGLDMIIIAGAIYNGIGAWRAKKRADAAGVEFINTAADKVLELHQPTGDYREFCENCGPGNAWPCAQYVQAMALKSESDKIKAKLAPHMVIQIGERGPEGPD